MPPPKRKRTLDSFRIFDNFPSSPGEQIDLSPQEERERRRKQDEKLQKFIKQNEKKYPRLSDFDKEYAKAMRERYGDVAFEQMAKTVSINSKIKGRGTKKKNKKKTAKRRKRSSSSSRRRKKKRRRTAK